MLQFDKLYHQECILSAILKYENIGNVVYFPLYLDTPLTAGYILYMFPAKSKKRRESFSTFLKQMEQAELFGCDNIMFH